MIRLVIMDRCKVTITLWPKLGEGVILILFILICFNYYNLLFLYNVIFISYNFWTGPFQYGNPHITKSLDFSQDHWPRWLIEKVGFELRVWHGSVVEDDIWNVTWKCKLYFLLKIKVFVLLFVLLSSICCTFLFKSKLFIILFFLSPTFT